MTQEEKLEEAKRLYETVNADQKYVLERLFPELKESDDEKIRKELIQFLQLPHPQFVGKRHQEEWITWIEKQGDTNETINRDEFAQGVLRGAAINLITWIDYNAAKGNMCLSNMECNDIENALVSGDWDKIYAYMKKKLEKRGEKEHVIAPKFNIGDTIRNKITNEVFTITDRCISLEYYHDINHSHEVKFSEQDNWELVVPKSQRMVSGEAKEEILSDELSEFEEAIRDTITTELCHNFGDVSVGVSISSEEAKLIAKKVLSIAEKEIRKKIVDEINAERIADDYIRTRKKEPLFGDGCFERAWLKEGIEITLNKILKE